VCEVYRELRHACFTTHPISIRFSYVESLDVTGRVVLLGRITRCDGLPSVRPETSSAKRMKKHFSGCHIECAAYRDATP